MSKKKSRNAGSLPAFKRRKRKPYWVKEWLQREYIEKTRSASDIAKECGGCESNVLYFLCKHGIKCRSMIEIRRLKKWSLSGSTNGMFGRCGSENPRWKGGVSPLRQQIYARSFWKEIEENVNRRDHGKCVRCDASKKGKKAMHTHHIKRWHDYPKLRFVLSNIVIVCRECHQWIHSQQNIHNAYLSP